VGERAAEGAAVAHLPVGHRLGRLGDQRRDQAISGSEMTSECVVIAPIDDRVSLLAGPPELGDPGQVDDRSPGRPPGAAA
jgi:hypothetical protein